MINFELDERLAADTLPIADLPLSRLLLMNDARYPWVILVPRHASISEVFELSAHDQQQLWREATQLGNAMKATLGGDKVNIATLGNVVSQLHVHVVIRRHGDATWPAPVWGNGSAKPYDLDGQAQLRDQLLALIDGLDM
ncbi:HIT domain-containing protein [Halomonas sp. ISL-60]|uniref:HIT domain-containing protein n=1 Tax=Halomonas sp. ISL-56 TaxID=2819149 RepID=UPI001BEA308D|nr:HIT domain-containing protein [Halomonas sp. ISL-56]MBT2773770.1 HIT domain-containing protein [Halomonas sp. ISL-60]MBT2801759.1 HIT domain-containing protein [Halomonas sp. ISL-56]